MKSYYKNHTKIQTGSGCYGPNAGKYSKYHQSKNISPFYFNAGQLNSLDHNFFENDSEEQLEEDMLDEENEEDDNADDTGDYMPPLLQGHRVTLEGKSTLFSIFEGESLASKD